MRVNLLETVLSPWPWYVAGPLIGLMVPLMLWLGNRQFGFSSNLRHLCAAIAPSRPQFLAYDWRSVGGWNLAFLAGTLLGGFIAVQWLGGGEVAVASETASALRGLGLGEFDGLVPFELFDLSVAFGPRGLVLLLGGGFLVGFGTQWAGGCTSGHGISGLANLELPSLIAVLGFFAGGLLGTYLVLPMVLRLPS